MRSLKKLNITKLVVLVVAGLSLTACAGGARPDAMTVGISQGTIISSTSPFKEAITLGAVDASATPSPTWHAGTTSEDFADAISRSLTLNILLAPQGDNGRYRLDATLLDLDQPIGGFDITVTAKAHYKLVEISSNKVLLDETIVTPHTTDFSDAFIGSERLRLANEGAIHDNIQALIKRIVNLKTPGG